MNHNDSSSASRRGALRTGILSLIVYTFCLFASPVQAQMVPSGGDTSTSVEVPDNLTREEVRDLVARLSDAEVRELIILQLDKQAVAPEEDADEAYVGQLQEGFQVARGTVARLFSSEGRIAELPSLIWNQLTDDGRIGGGFVFIQLVALLVAGFVAEALARRFFARGAGSNASHLEGTAFGAIVGVLCIAAFGGGAALAAQLTDQANPAAQLFWNELIWCLVLIKLVVLAVRHVAAPASAHNRLIDVSDQGARSMLAWTLILSSALILPEPLVAIVANAGGGDDLVLLVSFLAGAIFVAILIVMLVRLRHAGARMILGDDADAGSIRQGLARSWWILSIAYLLIIWLMAIGKRAATGESSMVPGLGSLLLLALLPFLDQGLKALIAWYFAKRGGDDNAGESAQPGEGAAEAASDTSEGTGVELVTDSERPHYHALALRYGRVILWLAVLIVFVRLWDLDLRAISAQLVGPTFASALFDISITVLLTWALWGIIRISIERKLDEGKPAGGDDEETEAGGMGGSRVETVLPLIRISIKITLVVMAVLISLSSLGVNIGPLIAGAGVVGIAVGFGAQTLVRDIVSGFFYLLDDAFRIGEYVEIDNIRGTVEKISVRSFQLRHHNGPVHTIPYGEIRHLTNWSRDWAIMKFELRIPFETDIDKVRKIIKKIGIDLMESEQFGPLMLQPLKSQGVNRMDDSALIIRCKFMTVPGQQYLIRREAFTRIQRVFEEQGIQFAPRRVLVEASTPDDAAKAAAAGALDQEKP